MYHRGVFPDSSIPLICADGLQIKRLVTVWMHPRQSHDFAMLALLPDREVKEGDLATASMLLMFTVAISCAAWINDSSRKFYVDLVDAMEFWRDRIKS